MRHSGPTNWHYIEWHAWPRQALNASYRWDRAELTLFLERLVYVGMTR